MTQGMKTSEFYLLIIGIILLVLNHILTLGLSAADIIGMFLGISAYTGGRSLVKANE